MKQRRFRMIAMKRKQASRVWRRCKDFEPGCMACAWYHFHTMFKRYPRTWSEACDHSDQLVALAETEAIKATNREYKI